MLISTEISLNSNLIDFSVHSNEYLCKKYRSSRACNPFRSDSQVIRKELSDHSLSAVIVTSAGSR